MEKVCNNCKIDGFEPEDIRCHQCGGELVERPAPDDKSAPKYSSNTKVYHNKGDKTIVGGDSFNAQSLDNRTITSNSNTTINNNINQEETVECEISGVTVRKLESAVCRSCGRRVSFELYLKPKRQCMDCFERTMNSATAPNANNAQAVVDETKTTIECEMSGMMILKVESAVCRVCKRRVAQKFYIEQSRMCEDCYDKKSAMPYSSGAAAVPVADMKNSGAKDIPAMVQPATGMDISNAPVVDRIRSNDDNKRRQKIIGIGVAVVLVLGIGIWALGGSSDNGKATASDVTEVTAPAPEATAAAAPDPAISGKAGSAPAQTAAVAKETAPVTTAKPAATQSAAKAIEPSSFDKGREAYLAGDFSTANIFLNQAVKDGNAGASYYLAQMYQNGKGVGKNVRQAFSHMLKAAQDGHPDAYFAVAEMYRTGAGTEPNRSLAKEWYEKAATSKSSDAGKASQALGKYY